MKNSNFNSNFFYNGHQIWYNSLSNEFLVLNNFLNELFQLCLKKKEVLEICQKHIKYQYLPNASYKEIWKQINREYEFNKNIPSIGVLYQNCKDKQ